jgi:hypothetical protein
LLPNSWKSISMVNSSTNFWTPTFQSLGSLQQTSRSLTSGWDCPQSPPRVWQCIVS